MKSNFAIRRIAILVLLVSAVARVCPGDDGAATLEQGFRSPPPEAKPSCYWYWISDNISKEGITRDLEAMARVGIGGAFIGNIFLDRMPVGDVKVLSEEWWQLIEHAVREGARTGVNIGLFNCPGWSQSGGPWVGPDQAMRYLASSETRVHGPRRVESKLLSPREDFQDVAVLAFPAPEHDGHALATVSPRLTCTPAAKDLDKLVDGDLDTAASLPRAKTVTIDIGLKEAVTARSLTLVPGDAAWAAQCELQAEKQGGTFNTVRTFKFDRSNMKVGVGPMPRGPVVVAFEPTTAKRFRLVLSDVGGRGKAELAEINLSPAARLESYVEKQLGKMHPTPLPMWDTYLWPSQPEPSVAGLTIPPQGVRDLTANLSPDGTLRWDAPAGDWVVVRMGMAPTGTHNSPASPEGQGFEVDKMNRDLAKHHFDAFVGQLLKRMPAKDRKAFTHVIADSYEQGSQNWTDRFGEVFRKRYGYDPLPWLPVLTGRIVGSADQSDRFLWDLRRLVADCIATEYVGGLRDLCQAHGLKLWLENYGHWGFPAEFLQYGGQSDCVGGEFWVTGSLGSIECRAASSAANIYGKPMVSAEAFTGGPAFRNAPSALKARGDWCFSEGINHLVLHVYIQQPWEDRKPGMNAWFGSEFNRHNTWFEQSKAWVDYLHRSCFLLQQGTRVADVAYFIGEDTPKMTGIREPALPAGYDFDYINAEVIQASLEVKDGRLVLPHGVTYRVLVLPEQKTMRPELLEKIGELVKAGATVVGSPPTRSPSMQNYPTCDTRIRDLATDIWRNKSRVVTQRNLESLFRDMGIQRDFTGEVPLRFTHRRASDADIYFVANPTPRATATRAAFRIGNSAPELWWPKSGRIERPAAYDVKDATVQLPLHLGPHGSVFVVFRDRPIESDRVVSVTRNGETILDASANLMQTAPMAGASEDAKKVSDNFTIALWAKPAADTVILPEKNSGVSGLGDSRNDAVSPTHGGSFGGDDHAGCGLAVGRNGVGVFEHGANYFAPTLIHKATLGDWTHVAIVYRDARPHLYLNGKPVHAGLKSNHAVHPGEPVSDGAPSFKGRLGETRIVNSAMTDEDVVELMAGMPKPGDRGPAPLSVTWEDGGRAEVRIEQSGTYIFKTASGRIDELPVSVPKPIRVEGPWTVRFTPGWGAPQKTTFASLADWTDHEDDGIKHYSGTATYCNTFKIDGNHTAGRRQILSLGKVHDLAVVRVNGREVGTLWMSPWDVDITDAVQPGGNKLEVDIINTWNNRLVGDAKLPAGKRKTWLGAQTVGAHVHLQAAGLLGPVELRSPTVVRLPKP